MSAGLCETRFKGIGRWYMGRMVWSATQSTLAKPSPENLE